MKLFCFGLGYVAKFLAKYKNVDVIGTNRSNGIIFKQQQSFNTKYLDGITHILISIPPIDHIDIVYQELLPSIHNLNKLKWLGYLSSTGVYGDHQGAWVNENSNTKSLNPRYRARLVAENAWLNSNLPIHIFRLAGIYGPGRSAIDNVINHKARRIYKSGQVFSRIHVLDIVNILYRSMLNPKPGNIYNLADDYPSPQTDLVEYACKLLNYPLPRLEDYNTAMISPMMHNFYSSCRRVSNIKVKKQLGINLKYPSYYEGLKAIVSEL